MTFAYHALMVCLIVNAAWFAWAKKPRRHGGE